MKIYCEACKSVFEAERPENGTQVACPKCGAMVNFPESPTSPGAVIGDFLIEREISKGGMGEVFLARQLSQKNLFSLSSEKNICVVAPEHDSNGLLIFRDNLRPMVSEKNVLLLISTVNSGKTAARALECIEYYGGTTQGVAAVFSALKQVGDIPVISLFSPEDIPGYVTSLVKDCPMCKAGQKIDALSNSYGFSPLT